MSDLFFSLFVLSFFSLFLFLIKPSLLFKWFKQEWSRKKIAKVFSAALVVFFILTGVFAPEVEQKETPTNNAEVLQNSDEATEHITEASSEAEQKELFLVTRVVDGDTIELESGQRVRYIGIDTPEIGSCYSSEATERNKALVLDKEVELIKDVSETDRYDRLLRYVYVDGQFVNEILVSEGYAFAKNYPPDSKYQDELSKAQSEAKDQDLGLWGEVCNPTPTPTPTTQPTYVPTPKPTYSPTPTPAPKSVIVPTSNPTQGSSSYSCNCSKTCSQMSSCNEAYYQLNTCGCSVRDGDHDGVPCENICPGG